MRGFEVIPNFHATTLLKAGSHGDPSSISLISPPLSYGYPTCLVPLDRYSQGASGRGSYVAHGPFSTNNVGIYRNTPFNTYCQYISTLSEITPIWTFPPSTIQVLGQFYSDSESFGGGFEVEFHGLLVG